MPGCDEHIEQWRELNPGFLMICWDSASLVDVLKQTPSISEISAFDHTKNRCVLAAAVAYQFGGIVVSTPETCATSLSEFYSNIASTLLATFEQPGSTSLDSSLVICSPKIGAFASLFQFLQQAILRQKPAELVFRDFVLQSKAASHENAILVLPPEKKDDITGRSRAPTVDFKPAPLLQSILPAARSYSIRGTASTLSHTLTPWLESMGFIKAESDTAEVAVLILDSETFDQAAPISGALAVVTDLQNVSLAPDALVFVAHCTADKAGMDMLMQPQMQLYNAKEVYRTDHVAWKLPAGTTRA